MVPLDLRGVILGRVSFERFLSSSVSVEVLDVDWDAGGVAADVVVTDGTVEDVKGSSATSWDSAICWNQGGSRTTTDINYIRSWSCTPFSSTSARLKIIFKLTKALTKWFSSVFGMQDPGKAILQERFDNVVLLRIEGSEEV